MDIQLTLDNNPNHDETNDDLVTLPQLSQLFGQLPDTGIFWQLFHFLMYILLKEVNANVSLILIFSQLWETSYKSIKLDAK